MAGLPKKYAKMGFKAGWRAYKRIKGKKTTKSRRGGVKTMARKRRRVYRRKAKQQTGFLGKMGKPIGAMAYGAIRERISDFVANSQIGRMIPATQLTDEVLMLGSMFVARKMGAGKKGILASVIRNGEAVEYARIGQTLSDMYMGGAVAKTNNVGVNGGIVYG